MPIDIKYKHIYETIGSKIRFFRKKNTKNQDWLAEKAEVTRTSIVQIEKGRQKIQIHTLYLIAEALQRPIFDFLPNEIENVHFDDMSKRKGIIDNPEIQLKLDSIVKDIQGDD